MRFTFGGKVSVVAKSLAGRLRMGENLENPSLTKPGGLRCNAPWGWGYFKRSGRLRLRLLRRKFPGIALRSGVAQFQQHLLDRIAAIFGAAQAVLGNGRDLDVFGGHAGPVNLELPRSGTVTV
jgi:hypothetical protein